MPLTHPHTSRLGRVLLGAVVTAAAFAPSASAAFYSPGAPGHVGTSVEYEDHTSLYDSIDGPSSGDSSQTERDSVRSQTGYAEGHTSGWLAVSPTWPPPITGCTGGCSDADAVAAGEADVAAGTLKAFARSNAWGWGGNESLGTARSKVNLDDTITVSKATTVTLKGRLVADLFRRSSDFDAVQDPSSSLDASVRIGYCGSEGCDPTTGFAERITPELLSSEASSVHEVDQPFEVQVAVPAGRSPVNAELYAQVSTVGEENGGSAAGSDAHVDRTSDADRLEFQIIVPDDVVVTSGSGKLPIVGGKQEEQDTTPPALVVPQGVTADATTPSGAVVNYTVQATDASGQPSVVCSPASGSTFALGTTTVTCVATDAAGNATTKSFAVTVRDAAAQLGTLRQKILQHNKATQTHLLPHLKEKCNSMSTLRHKLGLLVRKGELSQVQADVLRIDVDRIAGALGC